MEGFYHWYKKTRHLDSSMSPSSAVPVKSKISEVIEAITIIGQNLQKVLTESQMAPHLGIQDFPYQSANQTSFTANLLKIHSQGKTKERRESVTSPTSPEFIVKKKQELSSRGGKENSDKFHLKGYSKVLQAMSKELSSGKEQTDLPRTSASKTDWPITTFSAEKTCGAPKV